PTETLAVRAPRAFPTDLSPGAEAATLIARGIGAARAGDTETARTAIDALDGLHDRMTEAGEAYWTVLADAQRKAVGAWLAYHEGDSEQALTLMREAADREDSVDKHPVTPGAVLPARELLGDMLLMMERPDEALEAYRAALAISPNRFRSLYGAAQAAEQAGDDEAARGYYSQLVEVAAPEAERPALAEARRFLAAR